VQGKIVAEIGGLVGVESASAIQTMIEKARTPATGIFAMILSLITLLLGATGVVGELKDTLNTIWHVEPAPEMGLLRTLKTRLASLAFVLGVGFLLLVSLVISAVLAALHGFFSHPVFQSVAPAYLASRKLCRLLKCHHGAFRHALSLFTGHRDRLARCVDWSRDDRPPVRGQ